MFRGCKPTGAIRFMTMDYNLEANGMGKIPLKERPSAKNEANRDANPSRGEKKGKVQRREINKQTGHRDGAGIAP